MKMKHIVTYENFLSESAFHAALSKAKKEGLKEFEFNGKTYPVYEEDAIEEGNAFVFAAAKAKQDGKKEFEWRGKKYPVKIGDTGLK
jgi:hypothetical protein